MTVKQLWFVNLNKSKNLLERGEERENTWYIIVDVYLVASSTLSKLAKIINAEIKNLNLK